jgi:hypothetical protein
MAAVRVQPARMMSLALRNLLFTIVVPGSGAVWIPWWILTRGGPAPEPAAWPAISLIVAGTAHTPHTDRWPLGLSVGLG